MPMTADEVCRALIHEADRMEGFYAEEEAAIREAFAIAARAREELERLDKEISLDPRADTFESHRTCRLLKRILDDGEPEAIART